MGAVHSDCESRPVFVLGGCRLFHLYDKENRVYAGCVWIWHSLCFDQWMCLLSPLVTVSCCSYEHSSPTQTAGGPLALGSSFSPRTYRQERKKLLERKTLAQTLVCCFLCLCEFNDGIHWISSFCNCTLYLQWCFSKASFCVFVVSHCVLEWSTLAVSGDSGVLVNVGTLVVKCFHTHICFFFRHAGFTMLLRVTSGLQL